MLMNARNLPMNNWLVTHESSLADFFSLHVFRFTYFHYTYLHKARKKVNKALLDGNMTSCIWHYNEKNKHKRIIVLTRAVWLQVKGTGDWWTDEGSQAVFIYSSWHLASLSFRKLSLLALSRKFYSFTKESLPCLTFEVSSMRNSRWKRLNGDVSGWNMNCAGMCSGDDGRWKIGSKWKDGQTSVGQTSKHTAKDKQAG